MLYVGLIFLALIILGMPVAFVLGVSSLFAFLQMDNPNIYRLVIQRMFAGVDSFVLLAIPFFILAGEIMNRAGITSRLISFAQALVGHFRGGLATVNIVASMFFAGITGAAVADTAAIGSVLIPAMEERGYDKDFSAAVTATSSIIGPIIPPSIVMVLYGALMNVSIAGLFAAGIVPGILVGLFLILTSYSICRKRGYGIKEKRISFREFLVHLKDALLTLMLPVIILGGILGGIFTPTEAAAIAVGYALFIGFFVYKSLTIKDLFKMMIDTVTRSSIILLIISTASIFGWILTSEQIPSRVASFITSLTSNYFAILLMINLFLILMGMIMEISANIVLIGPVLAPIAVQLGIDPLHFGLIILINLLIGLATPPLGVCLFVACGVSNSTLEEISKAAIPFILTAIFVLLLVTYIPSITLFLPRLLGF